MEYCEIVRLVLMNPNLLILFIRSWMFFFHQVGIFVLKPNLASAEEKGCSTVLSDRDSLCFTERLVPLTRVQMLHAHVHTP